jgi:hypothetical protein
MINTPSCGGKILKLRKDISIIWKLFGQSFVSTVPRESPILEVQSRPSRGKKSMVELEWDVLNGLIV